MGWFTKEDVRAAMDIFKEQVAQAIDQAYPELRAPRRKKKGKGKKGC